MKAATKMLFTLAAVCLLAAMPAMAARNLLGKLRQRLKATQLEYFLCTIRPLAYHTYASSSEHSFHLRIVLCLRFAQTVPPCKSMCPCGWLT